MMENIRDRVMNDHNLPTHSERDSQGIWLETMPLPRDFRKRFVIEWWRCRRRQCRWRMLVKE